MGSFASRLKKMGRPGVRIPLHFLRAIHERSTALPRSAMTLRSKLDLNLLRVAVALLDAGSVSQAAKKLGISQPSVSESLAKLRSHFDEPLFVRSGNGMSPTPRGVEIGTAAREILLNVE